MYIIKIIIIVLFLCLCMYFFSFIVELHFVDRGTLHHLQFCTILAMINPVMENFWHPLPLMP